MSMVLDPVEISAQKKQVQGIVEDIAGMSPAVHWRYSAYSNERFPLRAYASALHGSGPDADEVMVIAVTWRNLKDTLGDRLIVGADILDGDGVILAESPRFDVPMPEESLVGKDLHEEIRRATAQVEVAMRKVNEWLDSQTSTIHGILADVS